jgi:hypothetical protein
MGSEPTILRSIRRIGDEQASRNSPDPKFNEGRDIRAIERALTEILLNPVTGPDLLSLIENYSTASWQLQFQTGPTAAKPGATIEFPICRQLTLKLQPLHHAG